MTDPDSEQWQGYVNQILYGADLREPLSDERLTRLVDALIEQRYFTLPVEDYYRAAARGLMSGESLTGDGSEADESVARDLVTRLLSALDERRPWPEPAFRRIDTADWSEALRQPIIGRIELGVDKVENTLHRRFSAVKTTNVELAAISLRLRSGRVVSLFGDRALNQAGVELRTDADAAATISEFMAVTGIDVLPPSAGSPPVP